MKSVGLVPEVGREDWAAGDGVVAALTRRVGAMSYHWILFDLVPADFCKVGGFKTSPFAFCDFCFFGNRIYERRKVFKAV